MRTRNLLVTALLCAMSFTLKAQKTSSVLRDTIRPQVGKPMPDFTLNDVTNYKSKRVSLNDFRGKWLFINMWSETCEPCIQKLPKLDSLYRGHQKEANWMLIGNNKKGEGDRTPTIFEKSKARYKLEIPSAYDSLLFDAWRFNSVPTMIIVDPTGIVRYVVIGIDLTERKIADLFQGKSIDLMEPMNEWTRFSMETTDMKTRKSDILKQSMLTKSSHDKPGRYWSVDRWLDFNWDKTGGITHSGEGLEYLYMLAYIGEITSQFDFTFPENNDVFWHVKTELTDSSLFDPYKNRFNYYLYLPPESRTREIVMATIRNDLKVTFGYEATIERRRVPVMELVAKADGLERLKTKGGEQKNLYENAVFGFTVKNLPASELLETVTLFIHSKFLKPFIPFVDKTGLTDNFDLTLDGDLSNYQDLQKALRLGILNNISNIKKWKQEIYL